MDSGISHRPIEATDEHSAISTWSGYEYQGQVSIYCVLKKLNQMNLEDVDEYELQIESLEDFSINRKNYPMSIHQVKAYTTTSAISSYKRAIFDLLGKGAKYSAINSYYLHTLLPIDFPKDDDLAPKGSAFKKQLQQINPKKNINQFQEYRKLLFDNDKYEEVLKKLNLNKFGNDELKTIIDRKEIDFEIKSQIKIFLKTNINLIGFVFRETNENIQYLYYNFIDEINLLVAKGHAEGNKEIKIPFSKFLKILQTEYVYRYSEKTAASSLKMSLSIYFDEYCEKIGLNPELHCEIWNKKWQWILKQTDRDFLLLCKKISPTINFDIRNLESHFLKEFVVKAGVHKTFFPMILNADAFSIKREGLEGLKEIFVLNKNGKRFLITTIAEVWGKNEAKNQGIKIYEALKNDNELLHLLFDIEVFITNEIRGEFDGKIIDTGLDYAVTIPGFENKENIFQLKPFEFIDIELTKKTFGLTKETFG